MGQYDDIRPEEIRGHLVRAAKLILRLDENGALLREAPRLQKLLGDLRQRLFAYEVRSAADLGPEDPEAGEGPNEADRDDDPVIQESIRVIRQALAREERLRNELESGTPDPDEDEGQGTS